MRIKCLAMGLEKIVEARTFAIVGGTIYIDGDEFAYYAGNGRWLGDPDIWSEIEVAQIIDENAISEMGEAIKRIEKGLLDGS